MFIRSMKTPAKPRGSASQASHNAFVVLLAAWHFSKSPVSIVCNSCYHTVCAHAVLYTKAALEYPPLCFPSQCINKNHSCIFLINLNMSIHVSTFLFVVSTSAIVQVLQKYQRVVWTFLVIYSANTIFSQFFLPQIINTS